MIAFGLQSTVTLPEGSNPPQWCKLGWQVLTDLSEKGSPHQKPLGNWHRVYHTELGLFTFQDFLLLQWSLTIYMSSCVWQTWWLATVVELRLHLVAELKLNIGTYFKKNYILVFIWGGREGGFGGVCIVLYNEDINLLYFLLTIGSCQINIYVSWCGKNLWYLIFHWYFIHRWTEGSHLAALPVKQSLQIVQTLCCIILLIENIYHTYTIHTIF